MGLCGSSWDCGFLGCQRITHSVCYNTGLGCRRWHFMEKRCENVFLWVFTAVLEQHNWKQPKEGRIYLFYVSWATDHWKKQRKEYKQGWNLEAAADIESIRVLRTGFLQMAWSAYFLMAPRTTSLRVAPIMVSWTLPISQQSRKCTTSLLTGQWSGIIFLNWCSPFQNDACLCQVSTKLVSTENLHF